MADTSPFKTSKEILIFGDRTEEWIKAHLPELKERQLSFVGITRARAPYQVARPHFEEGHLIATLDGEGEFWHGGEWRRCRAGDVFISPPQSPEAFRALPGKEWFFGWVHTLPGFFDLHPFSKAQIIQADPRPFHLALEGYLNNEPSNSPPGTSVLWAELLVVHVHHLMQLDKKGTRLWKVWEAVTKDPGRDWNVSILARIANLSREQLRCYSLKETGRAPMHQVAYLRVQRAIALLQTSQATLETISELVGYNNPFALSNTIHKLTGHRPSSYRAKNQEKIPLGNAIRLRSKKR